MRGEWIDYYTKKAIIGITCLLNLILLPLFLPFFLLGWLLSKLRELIKKIEAGEL